MADKAPIGKESTDSPDESEDSEEFEQVIHDVISLVHADVDSDAREEQHADVGDDERDDDFHLFSPVVVDIAIITNSRILLTKKICGPQLFWDGEIKRIWLEEFPNIIRALLVNWNYWDDKTYS